jgi:hypothetical protein
MAIEERLITIGFLAAGSDLSTKQYHVVKLDAQGKAVLAGAGELSLGILQNDPSEGQACDIAVDGVSKAKAGASITLGSLLSANANGQVVPATSGDYVIGIALEAASSGDIVSVLIRNFKI